MFKLNIGNSPTRVPFISNNLLDAYAEALVADFSQEFLKYPGIINVEAFIEYYLGLSIRYLHICYDRKVLGMTAFNNGMLDVIDDETGLPDSVPVTAGTVIIDTSLTTKRNLPRLRFTAMHEAGHWLIHREAFAEDNLYGPAGVYENKYLAAKEGHIDYSRSKKQWTVADRMERQADFLSSALLMPRPALREAYRQFFRLHNDKPRKVIKGKSKTDNFYAAKLPEFVSGLFGVSKRAALIRLEKLQAIVDCGTELAQAVC